MRRLPALLLCAAATVAVHAADKEEFGTLPEPPPPPADYRPSPPATAPAAKPDDAAIPEPEVVITTKGEDRYEEYRLGGRLYMIKVTPRIGRPYYLVDNEGRGQFTRSEFAPKISPPTWVIKRF
jgi:hypothetical protein